MPRAKISDAYGITVEVEAGEASYAELLAAASAEFERANQLIERKPTGGTTGFSTQIAPQPTRRRGTGDTKP